MISSQSRMVDSRWATMRQVQPRRRRLASTIALGLRVEGAGGLVEHEQLRVAGQGPGDLDALALPARQVAAALEDAGRVAAGEGADLVVDAGVPGGAHDVVDSGTVGSHRVRFSVTVASNR